MNIEEIKSFLEENKEEKNVLDFMSSITPGIDEAKLKSYADKEARRQVEAYKANTFQDSVKNEVDKRMEAKNHKEPWEIKMQEMEAKMATMETEKVTETRAKMVAINKTKALELLSTKNLTMPDDVLDMFVSDEEDKTIGLVNSFSDMMDGFSQSIKQDYLKSNNTPIPESNAQGGKNTPGDNATQGEWETYFSKNKGN